MAKFKYDDDVVTPKGTGWVTYAEDDYIEVSVNGAEFSFEAPFTGVRLEADVKAEADAIAKEKLIQAEYDAMTKFSALTDDEKIVAKVNWYTASALVQMVGGSAADWDELSETQKLNYAKVSL